MSKARLEAFSDAVIAIILTIMVLELRPPEGTTLRDLLPLGSQFLSYILSFVFIGIYWVNHHHLLQLVQRVTGAILWANLHLLFWLSLVPFATAWIGHYGYASFPVAAYGAILFFAAIAYFILSHLLLKAHGRESAFAQALGTDFKGRISIIIYAVALVVCWVAPWLSYGLYAAVALMWLVPDRRIERVLNRKRP